MAAKLTLDLLLLQWAQLLFCFILKNIQQILIVLIFQLLSFWQHWLKQLTHVSCFVSLSNIFSLVYILNMNRLSNEQRLQIIEFDYQNACSLKKHDRALLPFQGLFNRPTEAAIRAIVTKVRTKFTLLEIKPATRLRRL